MSNSTVGNIYAKIVDDVVHAVRESFDEYAPQPNVLEDFKREWQKKISQRKVAQMPWDPPPAPATSTPNAVPPTRPQPYTAPSGTSSQNDTKIKIEPGTSYDLQNLANSQSTTYSSSNAPIAIANASNELREKFGDKANDSIQKLNQDLGSTPHGQKRSLPAESPKQEHPDSKRRVTDYDSSLQAQSNQRIQELTNAQRKSSISAAQTDGASEWRALVAARTSVSAEDMKAADESIMSLARAQWKADEGNGLMEPFKKMPTASRASVNVKDRQKAEIGQVDGGDDDDDDDIKEEEADDAINSDLDDDEDDDVESGEDDDPQQLIVCTYEKVARVKNKWKCTLKDGILITGGQEYVFAKATGEFEW